MIKSFKEWKEEFVNKVTREQIMTAAQELNEKIKEEFNEWFGSKTIETIIFKHLHFPLAEKDNSAWRS